jgi:glucose uptake protein GlcU
MIHRTKATAAFALLALAFVFTTFTSPAGAARLASVHDQLGAAPEATTVVAGAVEAGTTSLESAATRAGETGRKVAMSLIGLAFAIAAIVLAFRRDFKEAAAVFAVGLVCVLLATPAGVSLLRQTVKAIVGS